MIKMKYTIPIKEKMVCASSTLSISSLNAVKVCRALNRKKFADAKEILDNILNRKVSLRGKYYTKTVEEISKLLKQLESNTKMKNMNPDIMTLFISAHRGPTIYRSRRRRQHGMQLKMCHIEAVLSEENGYGKEVRERGNKK